MLVDLFCTCKTCCSTASLTVVFNKAPRKRDKWLKYEQTSGAGFEYYRSRASPREAFLQDSSNSWSVKRASVAYATGGACYTCMSTSISSLFSTSFTSLTNHPIGTMPKNHLWRKDDYLAPCVRAATNSASGKKKNKIPGNCEDFWWLFNVSTRYSGET